LRFRRGGTSNGNGQGVDGESADNEGDDESDVGEHDDEEFREEEEQMRAAPGLRIWMQERRTGTSCTAAEKTSESTSTIL